MLAIIISRNVSQEKAWSAIDVGTVDLELINCNVGELLEEQLSDIEIQSLINYLENKDCAGEIPKYYKKHLSKLTIVMDCYVILIMVIHTHRYNEIFERGNFRVRP